MGLIPENELSRQAGAAIDPRTSGPVVFEDRMTSLPGVFACGNVAHVHGPGGLRHPGKRAAGRAAAAYIREGGEDAGPYLEVTPGADIGYTLPQRIRPAGWKNRYRSFSGCGALSRTRP